MALFGCSSSEPSSPLLRDWNRLDNSSMIIDPDTGKSISFNEWEDIIDRGADDDDVEDDRPTLFKTLVRIWARAIQREFTTTLAISTPRSRYGEYLRHLH